MALPWGSFAAAGWLPVDGADGRPDPSLSPWYEVELDRVTAPWAFLRDGKPNRAIAALEAMAILVAFVVLLLRQRERAVLLCVIEVQMTVPRMSEDFQPPIRALDLQLKPPRHRSLRDLVIVKNRKNTFETP